MKRHVRVFTLIYWTRRHSEEAPELAAAVADGSITLAEAQKMIGLPLKRAPLP